MRVAYTTAGVQYGEAAFAYGPYGTVASGDVWFEIADTDISGTSDFATTGIDGSRRSIMQLCMKLDMR